MIKTKEFKNFCDVFNDKELLENGNFKVITKSDNKGNTYLTSIKVVNGSLETNLRSINDLLNTPVIVKYEEPDYENCSFETVISNSYKYDNMKFKRKNKCITSLLKFDYDPVITEKYDKSEFIIKYINNTLTPTLTLDDYMATDWEIYL